MPAQPAQLKNSRRSQEEKTTLVTNAEGKGPEIIVDLQKGESFYYPLFAIWLEDADGKYIQTLYVAQSRSNRLFQICETGR